MKGVIIDLERCIGCKHCVIACAVEHSLSRDLFRAIEEEIPPVSRIFVDISTDAKTFPNKCRHCETPFCLQACPTSAIYREDEHFNVNIDPSRCIGCFMCAMLCPFGVIRFYPDSRFSWKDYVATKCDGCVERVKKKRIPACVEACKTKALKFGDVNEILREKHLVVIKQEVVPDNIQVWREINSYIMSE